MDARTLYQQAIVAIRDKKDVVAGRRLLLQSLQLDADNDMAWMWLCRTSNNPDKQLEYVERALQINPNNPYAQKFKRQIAQKPTMPAPEKARVAARKPNAIESKQIEGLLRKADAALKADNPEGAVEQWVNILQVNPTHDVALKNAVLHLVKLEFVQDAEALIQQAIDAGADSPAIFLTGIDLAKRSQDMARLDKFYAGLVSLPNVPDAQIVKIAQEYAKQDRVEEGIRFLTQVLEKRPNSPDVLHEMGDLHDRRGKKKDALRYYERAAKAGAGSRAAKEADKKLANYVPVITDKERGSIRLAWRETAGIALFYLVLALQDAGLNLANFGERWLGIVLAIAGGYLFVTATSSPQQAPIAGWLGGKIPTHKDELVPDVHSGIIQDPTALPIIPVGIRVVLGVAGGALLLVAFALTFGRALGLLSQPVPPFIPSPGFFFDI